MTNESLLNFKEYYDGRGRLCIFDHLPFDVKRVFTITEATAPHGDHAHKECHQIIICHQGDFAATVEDRTYLLYTPMEGLWVPPGLRVTLTNFSEGASAIVLCSEHYSEKDYIR